ncbi:hypothetical protein E2L08_13350 [Palleronia sediminis]|uniref:Lipoprotein n=1 Tax=Palleronia sediminis TaxID=2547833 RepID=A0A4R6A1L4_9RHOB|nr:hypothetical protein [Palleronia sediminis]TDL76575.1 hypothetical protein E2L08_13350 [Palleronia sediminis]
MGRYLVATAIVLSLAGCASRLNPLNWFGGAEARPAVAGARAVETDQRPLMPTVTDLRVTANPYGAVIQATGIPPVQGYWDGELVRVASAEAGVAVFAFRAVPPLRATGVATPRSREITVGAELSNRELDGIREIRVSGASGALSVRR